MERGRFRLQNRFTPDPNGIVGPHLSQRPAKAGKLHYAAPEPGHSQLG